MMISDPQFEVPEFEVLENTSEQRFELRRDGEVVSVADFTERAGVVVIPHVGTRLEHRGQGNAGRLMDGLLTLLRTSNRTIVPICPFAAQHIQDDPEWADLVHDSVM